MSPNIPNLISHPIFTPTFLNIGYFFQKILDFGTWVVGFFNGGGSSVGGSSFSVSTTIYVISYLISLFGITIIIFCIVRLVEIQKHEHVELKHMIAELDAKYAEKKEGSQINARWEHVINLSISPSPSDWRLAIIEADTILEGLLESKGYSGNGIGEKLKSIPPGDLSGIQAAWEAHLVRNRIAHDGMEFELSQRDCRHAIGLYEVVFRELGFVV